MLSPLKGIICAMVTPLTQQEGIDEEAAQKITKHIVSGGVDSLLVLGSTGEQIALDSSAKQVMIKTVRQTLPGNMPLLVGCGATSTKLAIQNVHMAEENGADAVFVTPPCFYPFGETALYEYYHAIAHQSKVPVYLYNISRFVGVKIPVETVKMLLDDPMIMGIKQSDRDLEYVQRLLEVSKDRKDFGVLQGSERVFLESFDMGCPAGVTVVGNVQARPAVALYRAWCDGDREKAEKLQQLSLDYVKAITMLGMFPKEIKICLENMGFCSDRMTSPFLDVTSEQKNRVLDAIKIIKDKQEVLL